MSFGQSPPSPSENVLVRAQRLAGPTTPRRHDRVDSPTGHTYVTYPGSVHLFPALCEPTATLWHGDTPVVEPTVGRGVMMPKRRHTRADNRTRAITAERRLNDPHVTERNKPPPF